MAEIPVSTASNAPAYKPDEVVMFRVTEFCSGRERGCSRERSWLENLGGPGV